MALVPRSWRVLKGDGVDIDRRVDGYYLVPGRRSQVQLNGNRVSNEVKLKDGDSVSSRRVAIQFVADR
jgi:hypothetical protein